MGSLFIELSGYWIIIHLDYKPRSQTKNKSGGTRLGHIKQAICALTTTDFAKYFSMTSP